MGSEFVPLLLTAIISSVTGGGWIASKVLDRHRERLKDTMQSVEFQRSRINSLEEHVNRMPLEYVLKADFVREMRDMNDHFRAIHDKLDKLVEKLITK